MAMDDHVMTIVMRGMGMDEHVIATDDYGITTYDHS